MATETTKQYFKSADIKVFPCSYRGNYLITTGDHQHQTYAFDPESRLTTEYNFTHLHSVGDMSSSYIIAYDESDSTNKILYCVIGGYYFEISHINRYLDNLKDKFLTIQLKTIELKVDVDSTSGADAIDSNRYTYALASWKSISADLDAQADGTGAWEFTGLAIASDTQGADAALKVFDDRGRLILENLKPVFSHGAGENSIKFGDTDNNKATGRYTVVQGKYTEAKGIYSHAEGEGQKINEVLTPTLAEGEGSHAEGFATNSKGICSHTEGKYTRVNEEGNYAHAEGLSTKAKGEGSHAEGESDGTKINTKGKASHSEGHLTVAEGNYSHAEGENTEAIGIGSHTGGHGTKTTKNYTTVVGKYNADVDGEFIVGIGDGNTNRDNALIVNGKTTLVENTIKVGEDISSASLAPTFETNPNKTDILTATNTIYGSSANIIKTDADHYFEIKATGDGDDKEYSATLTDDKITIHSGGVNDGAYIMLEKAKGLLISYSKEGEVAERYNPEENITQDTITVAGKNIKLNSVNTELNSESNISAKIGTAQKVLINKDQIKLEDNEINLNGETNITGDTTIVGVTDITGATTIKASTAANSNKIVLNTNNTTITGPAIINGATNINENAKVSGIITFGKGDGSATAVTDSNGKITSYNYTQGTDGKIRYRGTDDKGKPCEYDVLVAKDAIWGPGVILGGGGGTCVKAGEEGSKVITNWDLEDLHLTADDNVYIKTNLQNGRNNPHTWVFSTDGSLTAPTCTDGEELTLLTAKMATNDFFRIHVGGTSNAGWAELATADDGNEPIYVRQYTYQSGVGTWATKKREAVLLDTSGNTSFPGEFECAGFSTKGREGCGLYLEDQNEINFSVGQAGNVWFGYTQHGNYKVTNYYFCDGRGSGSAQAATGSSVIAGQFNAVSDARFKENIKEFNSEKSILDLPVYKYDFIDGKKNQVGCLAQDLQKICPEIVHEDENGYLSIQESKIVYLLLDEVKKLRKEINALKGE